MPYSGHMPPVRAATRRDIGTVAVLAAHATRDHPSAAWLQPQPDARTALLHTWWALLAEHGLNHGHVDLLADHSAAAIWLDRTRPNPPGYPWRTAAAFSTVIDAATLLAQVLAHHRPPLAHLYLAALAVAPTRRRQGRATTLLAHRHRDLDRCGTYAYCEAGTEAQLALHTALGYQPGEPFHLPAGPAIWPMLRAPQGGNRGDADDERFWPPDID